MLRFKVGAAKGRKDFKLLKMGTSAAFKQSVTFPNVVGPAERLLPDVGSQLVLMFTVSASDFLGQYIKAVKHALALIDATIALLGPRC